MPKTIETLPLYKLRAGLLTMIAGESTILAVLIAAGDSVIIAAAVAGASTLANTVLTIWLTGRQRDPLRKRRRNHHDDE
jgi:hypothetical protein